VKIKGEWRYLNRAVDKQGNAIDFLLTAKGDKKALQT
jgi:transposase-like protein